MQHNPEATKQPAQFFPLCDVRVTSAPFVEAMDTDKAYLLRLEPDRFLCWFRKEAGLVPKGEVYGGWESQGVAGQTLGHYLSALCLMYQSTGDAELLNRANYIVGELTECQQANGDGYVAATPDGKALYAKIRAGEIQSKGGFDLNGGWVPLYTMHKVLAGLLDAYRLCDNLLALEVAMRLADWCADTFGALSYEKMQFVLSVEHGGMAESLADLYAISGESRFLDLARKFRHDELFLPAAEGRDDLNGRHANTQIPKFIGYQRIYEVTGEEDWSRSARNFWNFVARNRSFAIGGNSNDEHFFPVDKFETTMNEGGGPETCNTYNMLKLTRQLWAQSPDAALMDFAERALWNHILSSQRSQTGGFVYYTGVRPESIRTYSDDCSSFWCCVGSGMENHAKYGDLIYAHQRDTLFVNQFIASELSWREYNIRVTQQTEFPNQARTTLRFELDSPRRFSVAVRCPDWVDKSYAVMSVNGQEYAIQTRTDGYWIITREWQDGEEMTVELPLRLHVESLRGSSKYAAILCGPIVLAGVHDELQTSVKGVPSPLPAAERPCILIPAAEIVAHLHPVADRSLTFKSQGLAKPHELTLVPFYNLGDRRYSLYWPLEDESTWDARQREFIAQAECQKILEARTVDSVQAGEQQPEVDHQIRGEKTTSGHDNERGWRHADDGGWFSYVLKVEDGAPLQLLCTYWSANTPQEFDVFVDEVRLSTEKLGAQSPGECLEVVHSIPLELTKRKSAVTVKWQSRPGSVASLSGCRVLRSNVAST